MNYHSVNGISHSPIFNSMNGNFSETGMTISKGCLKLELKVYSRTTAFGSIFKRENLDLELDSNLSRNSGADFYATQVLTHPRG